MNKRKCTHCQAMIPIIDANLELTVQDGIHVTIICPHCGEDSEFAVIEERELIKAIY